MRFTYAAKITLQDDDTWIATCRDLPEAMTDGVTLAEAMIEMSHALGAALAGYVKARRLIPSPSRPLQGEFSVPVPALIACKLILRQIMQDAAVSNVSLAQRLGVSEGVVRRLVDPDHASRLDRVVAAVECLGKSIVVEACELEPA
jgi:antitoxin HicB